MSQREPLTKHPRSMAAAIFFATAVCVVAGGCGPWLTPIPTYWDPVSSRLPPAPAAEPAQEARGITTADIAPTSPPAKPRATPPPPTAVDSEPPLCSAYAKGFDSGHGGATCTVRLAAGRMRKSSLGCYVDEVIKGNVGVLTYPCAGGGATATFGGKSFFGVVDGDRVHLCTRTEFPFSDGCTWQSAQELSGSLDSGVLEFDYTERPKAKQSGCAGACTATTELGVQR